MPILRTPFPFLCQDDMPPPSIWTRLILSYDAQPCLSSSLGILGPSFMPKLLFLCQVEACQAPIAVPTCSLIICLLGILAETVHLSYLLMRKFNPRRLFHSAESFPPHPDSRFLPKWNHVVAIQRTCRLVAWSLSSLATTVPIGPIAALPKVIKAYFPNCLTWIACSQD